MEPSTSRTISASAVTSLVLGLLAWGLLLFVIDAHKTLDELLLIGFVAALLCSLGAIVFAYGARAARDADPKTGGRQVALAGLILGWTATALAILLAVFAVSMVFPVILFFFKPFG